MNNDELKELGETLIGISRGEPWQFDYLNRGWETPIKGKDPRAFIFGGYKIRLKPWQLTDSINGFTLPFGKEWHRGDFTKADLEDGHRPLMLGEEVVPWKDELFDLGDWVDARAVFEARPVNVKARTKRPIPAPTVLTAEKVTDAPQKLPELLLDQEVGEAAVKWWDHHVKENPGLIVGCSLLQAFGAGYKSAKQHTK